LLTHPQYGCVCWCAIMFAAVRRNTSCNSALLREACGPSSSRRVIELLCTEQTSNNLFNNGNRNFEKVTAALCDCVSRLTEFSAARMRASHLHFLDWRLFIFQAPTMQGSRKCCETWPFITRRTLTICSLCA